jgi:hypothetical protein
MFWYEINILNKEEGVPGRTHKTYFSVVQTCSPLLMMYLGNVKL